MRARELADKLEGKKITFRLKAGDNGKLFGSITAKDIAEQIKMQLHLEVDKKKIHMDDAIKNLGITNVTVKVYPSITAEVKVEVLSL